MLEENQLLKFTKDGDGLFVKTRNAKKPFFLKRFEYYEELASFVEILKTEGWWGANGAISITNKSPELVELFEYLLGVQKIGAHKSLQIKVKIPAGFKKENKIIVLRESKERKFYHGRNGFTQELDHIVFSDKFEPAKYKVLFGEKEFSFETYVSENRTETSMKEARIYTVIRANNKSFTTLLDSVLGEKTHSKEIRISKNLEESDPSLIAKVFARVVDCEGSIRFSGHTRNIRIRMANREYLEGWKGLLKKIGIDSNVSNEEKGLAKLTVTCNQNFKRLESLGFSLCHKTKKERFQRIMKSYKKHQFQRNTALQTYLHQIENNPRISALELSKKLNKSKRVVSHYLVRLKRMGKLNIEAIGQKYLYSAQT